MNTKKIGWIGLGNMGIPMAMNLVKAGYETVVFNRTTQKEKVLIDAGATSAPTLPQLIANCDVVVTMLSDDEAVKQVIEEGLLTKDHPGKLIINMSTIAPETNKYLEKRCNQRKVNFMEAPVSGSVKPAEDGTLIILAGGKEDDYKIAKPLFEVLGKISLLLGPIGVGSSAKLAINYLLGLNLQGLAETVLFAESHGVKREDMLTIVNEGACGNGITKIKTAPILNSSFQAAFALKHLVKDLRLAKESGLSSPLIHPLFDTYQKAQDTGLGEEDVMAVIKTLK
jgi:3-hydroxyisobutyrate dehydrogenase